MYIMDDGVRLNAKLERPEGAAGKTPILVILHGFTGDMEEEQLTAAAGAALSLGWAALRVDLYGHGKSDGRFRDHTLLKWLENALTVIDYARSLDFVSGVFLCGHSQGGLTALMAAAVKHDQLRGLVLMSPAALIPEGARSGRTLRNSCDPERLPDELPAWNGRTLGGNYYRLAQLIRVEQYVERYPGPVLLLHGAADELVPLRVSEALAAQYKNATLVPIPGADHCFEGGLEPMTAALRDWLRRQEN